MTTCTRCSGVPIFANAGGTYTHATTLSTVCAYPNASYLAAPKAEVSR